MDIHGHCVHANINLDTGDTIHDESIYCKFAGPYVLQCTW